MNTFQPGKLVRLRGRDWIVLPSDDENLLVVKPLGGSDEEITGVYLPLSIPTDTVADASFEAPCPEDIGDIATARLLYDAARLAFRNGAGPFRALAKLSFRPRPYQMVPLVMALRLDRVRLLVADDVGVGKTVEALLIVRELLERRKIARFAVLCPPHLCEQWQREIAAKVGLEAVIIRSSTKAQLDNQIQSDISVYEYYPFQVISTDFIKGEAHSSVFVEQCPELVIVDEAHSCARPSGLTDSRQQRFHLISRIAAKPLQHLILLTATPHSGKPEEFHSLLGLLKPDFEMLDLPASTVAERKDLAQYFVQRKRSDVSKWMGEETPFPDRDSIEWPYTLSPDYAGFFSDMIEFARSLVTASHTGPGLQRVHYWAALALLRGVMSSPAAGIEMLKTKVTALESAGDDQEFEPNPIGDTELGFEIDTTPISVIERHEWSGTQRRLLNEFAVRLVKLADLKSDQKLASAELILSEWIKQGYQPVVFCRYIATANYLASQLRPLLTAHFPDIDIRVITSDMPDVMRPLEIEAMNDAGRRLLIATDCLSEGIDLQKSFTAVLHYDLPWNPNRLEQREGRVDRFGQTSPVVKTCLLWGSDNDIDAIVLDVLLRKVKEIKRSTGINVPFPDDSQSIIDTITKSLLLNPQGSRRRSAADAQMSLSFEGNNEVAAMKQEVSRKIDEAAEREKFSRSIFAQHAIHAQEIEADLHEVDEAIGDIGAVEQFVTSSLSNLFNVQVFREPHGYRIIKAQLPPQLAGDLPEKESVRFSFISPTPDGYLYLGRNHPFVESLCGLVMASTLARTEQKAARAAVIRTQDVEIKTTIVLFRCRNVIEERKVRRQIVAEEMLIWGWKGTPGSMEFLDHHAAKQLLLNAKATSALAKQARAGFLENELKLMQGFDRDIARVAEAQSKKLVAAHERFSTLVDGGRFQVVYPVLPMDLLGIYILLPDQGGIKEPSTT